MVRFFRVVLLWSVASIATFASSAATAEAQVRPLDLRPSFGAPAAPAGTVPGAMAGRAIPPRADQRAPQAPARRTRMFAWEIEVHAGGSFAGDSKGTTTLPAPGGTFPTFNGLPTRSVRSVLRRRSHVAERQPSSLASPRVLPARFGSIRQA
jgi:hypothetical protein